MTPQGNIIEDSQPLKGLRTVIVEDEGTTVMQLKRILTRSGVTVVGAANNGKSGMEMILAEHPDLVLMDINMPLMNGIDAAKQILAARRTCIIMLTAYEDFRELAAEIGAAGYIVKPITSDTLIPQLETAYLTYQQPWKSSSTGKENGPV